MTNRLPQKPLVIAMSRMRKTAVMGAAATALLAVAPSLYAAEPIGQATTVQAAVRSILGTPLPKVSAFGALQMPPVGVSSIVISNEDDITVGDDETALGQVSEQDDISLVNTGDLTGGIGIDVSTGADTSEVRLDETQTRVYAFNYASLYDDAGNPLIGGDGLPLLAAKSQATYNVRTTLLTQDPLDSAISIDNSGSIAFAGRYGIRASNPAGDSIDIVSTGDITSTQDTESRFGIHASTKTTEYQDTLAYSVTDGEFTYNAYGQLTGVVTPTEYMADRHIVDMEYDAGSIAIRNSGDIDMGATALPSDPYAPRVLLSAGIFAEGDGGTTIVNTGNIKVDKWSSGIHVASTATTSISNSGRIEVGNGSIGIDFDSGRGSAGDYRLGGDVYILNTGDILGGVTQSEAGPGEALSVTGIGVSSLGSNNEYLAPLVHLNEVYAEYNEILGSEDFELFDVPNTRLYATTTVNRGHIELRDVGRGLFVKSLAGESSAINEGTIVVGDGNSYALGNFNNPSAGIFQVGGSFSSLISVNAATGVIVTGDDSAGIQNFNLGGDSIAINEGSITTGNGDSSPVTDYTGATFDKLFLSHGIWTISAAPAMGSTAYARNSGSITVGELAAGMAVSGQGYRVLDPTASTAINFNEGIISTGDNSSGMLTVGTNTTTFNTGRITTGNYDISAYQPHPVYTADEFAELRFGAASSGTTLAELINYGSITTGDGTIGASARMFFPSYGTIPTYGIAARLIQSEAGTITTGDNAIGAQVIGNYYATFINEGGIAVGHSSVGADLSVGGALLRRYEETATVVEGGIYASNAGIISTGDNSVGMRIAGFHDDVAYSGSVYVPGPDPYTPGYIRDILGTVDVSGTAYLVNTGTIRVGANSTGVEITGEAANEQGLQLVNAGTISAGSGTAIRLNAGNDIDSHLLNMGQITGDIEFGAGDDRLTNRQFVDDFGQLVSTGNITMYGSTIDFGAGSNRFDNDRGVITVAGGDNLITGADLFMTQASIEARNDVVGSRLTIDGNLSGSFTFGTDVSSAGADQLVITGDVADGSAMSVVLNPTEQFRGETGFTVITVEGENGADAPVVAGVTGGFADSLLDAEASFDEATGQVRVTANFGMGHMATAAASTTTMAQNWWMQSVGNYKQRNLHKLANANDTGLSVWGTAFHEEGTIKPDNDLQSTSFDQKLSGLQTGVQWTQDLGGGSFSVSPMFSYGDARASQNANLGSATGDAMAYGLNANYTLKNGLYFDATWQKSTMEVDFRTPGTVSNARGETDADGDGFNVEMGYAHKLKSGLTLAPQLQYGDVKVDLDDFASSDGTYDFSDAGGRYSLLRAGMSVFKTFETKNGSITPLADLNYLYATEGDSELFSNGVWFANDTTGSGYSAEFGLAGRYKDWDISGRVGLSDASASDHVLSSNLTVRYRW